ncbi:MAG: sugar phosphate isomerase/epimerase [Anaerolineales bacterium]|nr:sugar phosphate isomerase/epimerase [Anaerolineales bacterium]
MLIGNPMIFRELPLEAALRQTQALGFDALELWPPQIAACRTDALRRQLAEHCAGLGLPLVRLNAAGADYFGPWETPASGAQFLDGLKRDIDAAAALGMGEVLTWEGRAPAGATERDIFGWVLDESVKLFRAATDYARARGMRLSVEVHPFTLGIDLRFLDALMAGVGADDFGVTYDCCHFGVGLPHSYVPAISALGPRLHHVHFCDSDQVSAELHFPPGRGRLDLDGIVAALRGIGFRGSLMLDLWLYPLPEAGARIGVPYARRVMDALSLPPTRPQRQER